MAVHLSLADAIERYVPDGASVALEGFTHLIPFAAGHELIRQRRRELHLIRLTPDLIYDQLIGAGCARRLTFSWGGNPGVGSLHRLRDAVEHGWPHPLELDEHSHAGLAAAYVAGASRLPFGSLRGYLDNDLAAANPRIGRVTCPFTGEVLAAVPAINPDVTILHAQVADRAGNVAIHGIVGAQREAALAARTLVVTVEEIVDALPPMLNAIVLPHWIVAAVVHCPGGAYPSYAHGHYGRDNAFYQRWDAIARSRETFTAWIDENVHGRADHAGFLAGLREEVTLPMDGRVPRAQDAQERP
ncbi:MAG: CoA transferase subunit A [Arenimonas sp.]